MPNRKSTGKTSSQVRQSRQETAARYNLTAPEQRAGETSEAYLKRLAKMADQRLVRLEKLAQSIPEFANIKQFAYAMAEQDIKSFGGAVEGKAPRFNRVSSMKKTKSGEFRQADINARINAMKKFLESATSTKRTIVKSYQSRAKTLNDRYGTDFTWQDLAKFFDRYKSILENDKFKDSKTVLKAIASINNMGTDLNPETIEKVNEGSYKLSDDAVVNETILKLLQDEGFRSTSELFPA